MKISPQYSLFVSWISFLHAATMGKKQWQNIQVNYPSVLRSEVLGSKSDLSFFAFGCLWGIFLHPCFQRTPDPLTFPALHASSILGSCLCSSNFCLFFHLSCSSQLSLLNKTTVMILWVQIIQVAQSDLHMLRIVIPSMDFILPYKVAWLVAEN